MRAQIIPEPPQNLIVEPRLYMLLRFRKQLAEEFARPETKPFHPFEIFDHTARPLARLPTVALDCGFAAGAVHLWRREPPYACSVATRSASSH